MMRVHRLKSRPEFFQPIATGERMFTLRRNDRKFKVGDIIELSGCRTPTRKAAAST
jgi:hypothetical protein